MAAAAGAADYRRDVADTLAAGAAERDRDPVYSDRRVSVTGRLAHDQWETDGQKRQRHYIVADNVEFLDPRPNGIQVEANEPDDK